MMTTSKAWQDSLLNNLAASGEAGLHTSEYIRENNIRLCVADTKATNLWWKMKFSASGPHIQPAMYLSQFLADKPPHSPWLMASIVHETRHLEQGFWTAFSVYGELDAWQIGFLFYETLPGHRAISQPIQQLLSLPLSHDRSILRQARDLINQHENGGSSFGRQMFWVLSRKKSSQNIYWIKLMPLNPLIS